MKIYVTIDDNGSVTGISQLTGEVMNPKMIEVPEYSGSYMWKKWTGTEWIADQDKIDAHAATVAANAAKLQEIADNLPSWTQVSTAVDDIANLADAKAFIKKLSRCVYLDLKNSVD